MLQKVFFGSHYNLVKKKEDNVSILCSLSLEMVHSRTNYKRKKSRSHNTLHSTLNSDVIYIDLSKSLHRDGWTNETNIKVGNFPLTGRGIYSKTNMQANTVLMSLPINSLISILTIEQDHTFKRCLLNLENISNRVVNAQSLLAFYLLYLKHHKRKTEYIATIPSTFTVPYFCTHIEKTHMLAKVKEKISIQQNIIERDFNYFQQYFDITKCDCCQTQKFCNIFQLSAFKWAFFAINSRSVYLNLNAVEKIGFIADNEIRSLLIDEPTLALAPFLDLLNHSCLAGTKAEVKQISNELLYQLYTTVPFKKYEQIFISYGALDNVKLLTDYGFFLPNNEHDFIDMDASDVNEFLSKLPYKLKVFILNHKLNENLYVARHSGLSHNLRLLNYIASYAQQNDNQNEKILKLILYGNRESLDGNSIDYSNRFAIDVINGKIKTLKQSLDELEVVRKNDNLTEMAIVYCNYLMDSIKWLTDYIHTNTKIE